MKYVISILLFFLVITANARIRYISPRGNDTNSGADTSATGAWATWQKGFDEAVPGDTIYYMGGVYYSLGYAMLDPEDNSTGVSGTAENPIMYASYPGQWAILDCIQHCDNAPNGGADYYNKALKIRHVSYITFKDFEVRNVLQCDTVLDAAIQVAWCARMTFDHIVIHDISERGLSYFAELGGDDPYWDFPTDTVRFTNCDIYNICDSLDMYNQLGNGGDGYHTSTTSSDVVFIWEGCRVWNISDDAWNIDGGNGALRIINNCWAMPSDKYFYSGDGWETERNGFKMGWNNSLDGWQTTIYPEPEGHNTIQVSNSLVLFAHHAFREGPTNVGYYHNNTVYGSEIGFYAEPDVATDYIRPSYKNNLVYKSSRDWAGIPGYDYMVYFPITDPYDESHNTWDYDDGGLPNFVISDSITITDDDFIGLDGSDYADSLYLVAMFTAARQSDGSLPVPKPLALTSTSGLIDAGTRYISVGTQTVDTILSSPSYYGGAPDIGYAEYTPGPQIIADHSVVDDFDDIPQFYIDSVKKMWVSYAGESHSTAIPYGMGLLEALYPEYDVSVQFSGTPEAYTDQHLRVANARWGRYYGGLGWVYLTGEEDWFTNSSSTSGIPEIKTGISYAYHSGVPVTAMGFGWCFDAVYGDGTAGTDPVTGNKWYGRSVLGPEGNLPWGLDAEDYAITGNTVSLDTYLSATQEYIDYCADSIPTKIFFTTTTVDHYDGEAGYQGYLKDERIRNYVAEDPTRILFDWADILCYDDGETTPNTASWNGNTYPYITDDLAQPETGDYHFTEEGAIRLAKAMWWMLARMAGWDGNVTVYSEPEEPQVDSTLTDILTFTLPTQTAAATINTISHTVIIEVAYTADITSLSPTITLSYGATVIPLSGVARDFTTPVTYTVTALDETTTQEWTVTVTQEAEPVTPVPTGGAIVKFNGKIVKR